MAGTKSKSNPAQDVEDQFDNRRSEHQVFDDTKAGVKGLVDAGIEKIPAIFHCNHLGFNDNNLIKMLPQEAKQPCVPVIDMDGMGSDPVRRAEVIEKVRDACAGWGFFQIVNHGIPVNLLDETIDGVRGFHEQETRVKKEFYTRDRSKKVLYLSNFDLFHAPAANWRDTLAWKIEPSHQLPDKEELPSVCRDVLMSYQREVKQLGQTLFELMSEALGLKPSHLKEMECAESVLILGHYYPPCPQPELTIGTTSHADSDFLTVLLQDSIGGLQILHQNQWVDVPPLQGALIINIGDLFQLVSNDKFISVNHRVLSKTEGPRVSIASFFRPRDATSRKYGPIGEMISEENPPVYRHIDLKEYMDYFIGKGLDGTSALRPFKL